MGFKLGDISPLAGLATGKGFTADIARTGMLGLAPYLATKNRGDKKKKRPDGTDDDMQAPGMKKGGKVKAKKCAASKRGDGCAQRGKTRGKFV